MAQKKSKFVCQECQTETPGWLGRCPGCGAWNSLVEEQISPPKTGHRQLFAKDDAQLTLLPDIAMAQTPRFKSGLSELDRVLGGGFVPGSLVLIGGDPGIGKSTLLLQSLALMSDTASLLYVSGEESPQQVKIRSERLKVAAKPLPVLAATDFSTISEAIVRHRPRLAVIDSIQTVFVADIGSTPGSVSQIREATAGLLNIAKTYDIVIVLVGHVTKDGAIAGPRVLEHMVDTVLYFEGDAHLNYRMLRAVKNRFGPTDELGLFEMTGSGLKEVKDASAALLKGRPLEVPGSAVSCTVEGTRPLLVEIQALAQTTAFGSPQRMAQGLDRNRVSMLLAVLEKQLNLGLSTMDTYVNVVGGLRLTEPAVDLAVIAALVSSAKGRPVRTNCLVIGEIGLTGEIRPVTKIDRRVQEGARQNFTQVILPASCRQAINPQNLPDSLNLYYVDHLGEALDILLTAEVMP